MKTSANIIPFARIPLARFVFCGVITLAMINAAWSSHHVTMGTLKIRNLQAHRGAQHKSSVVGKWKVDPALAASNPAGLPQGFMNGFASTFRYTFKANGSFTGSMSTGTYTLKGSKVAMTTRTLGGKPISEMGGSAAKPQMTGELSADGKVLVLHPPIGNNPQLQALKNVKMVRDR